MIIVAVAAAYMRHLLLWIKCAFFSAYALLPISIDKREIIDRNDSGVFNVVV